MDQRSGSQANTCENAVVAYDELTARWRYRFDTLWCPEVSSRLPVLGGNVVAVTAYDLIRWLQWRHPCSKICSQRTQEGCS